MDATTIRLLRGKEKETNFGDSFQLGFSQALKEKSEKEYKDLQMENLRQEFALRAEAAKRDEERLELSREGVKRDIIKDEFNMSHTLRQEQHQQEVFQEQKWHTRQSLGLQAAQVNVARGHLAIAQHKAEMEKNSAMRLMAGEKALVDYIQGGIGGDTVPVMGAQIRINDQQRRAGVTDEVLRIAQETGANPGELLKIAKSYLEVKQPTGNVKMEKVISAGAPQIKITNMDSGDVANIPYGGGVEEKHYDQIYQQGTQLQKSFSEAVDKQFNLIKGQPPGMPISVEKPVEDLVARYFQIKKTAERAALEEFGVGSYNELVDKRINSKLFPAVGEEELGKIRSLFYGHGITLPIDQEASQRKEFLSSIHQSFEAAKGGGDFWNWVDKQRASKYLSIAERLLFNEALDFYTSQRGIVKGGSSVKFEDLNGNVPVF